jgi:hypothetical protein
LKGIVTDQIAPGPAQIGFNPQLIPDISGITANFIFFDEPTSRTMKKYLLLAAFLPLLAHAQKIALNKVNDFTHDSVRVTTWNPFV